MVEILTDNKNRTAAEIRHIFSKHNGHLGENGCVSWMFNKKGLITFDKKMVDEEKLMDVALDAGAEDINEEESSWEIVTKQKDFLSVKNAIDQQNDFPKYSFAEITMIPSNTVKISGKEAEQMIRLMEALEDSEDVQNVYANFDIPESEMESV